MLKKYESMIILLPSLTEENAKVENAKIHSYITEIGGEILNTDEWGKKRLAYDIQDNREGYYFVNYFTFDPANVSKLDRFFKLNENIIRHNILTK